MVMSAVTPVAVGSRRESSRRARARRAAPLVAAVAETSRTRPSRSRTRTLACHRPLGVSWTQTSPVSPGVSRGRGMIRKPSSAELVRPAAQPKPRCREGGNAHSGRCAAAAGRVGRSATGPGSSPARLGTPRPRPASAGARACAHHHSIRLCLSSSCRVGVQRPQGLLTRRGQGHWAQSPSSPAWECGRCTIASVNSRRPARAPGGVRR
jgi:hypothetical protein